MLAGLAGLVAGGAAGVGAGFLRTRRHRRRPQAPPAALRDALAAEQQLLAVLDASIRAHPELRTTLMPVRRDHVAHAAALRNALRPYRSVTPATASATASAGPRVPARGRAALAAAETAAAATATRHAAALTGADAALLASIAACEATHAEVLA